MELIKPREITGKILTVIDESADHLILVTPYINIGKWVKVRTALDRALKRHVAIQFYLRHSTDPTSSRLTNFKADVSYIYRLHAKLYLSEKAAVFTSMNLDQSSDERSTDLGLFTEDKQQIDEYHKFVDIYLKSNRLIDVSKKLHSEMNRKSKRKTLDIIAYEQLGSALNNLAPNVKWTDGKSYWFSSNAMNHGDVMINREITWKLYKEDPESEKDLDGVTRKLTSYYAGKVEIEIDRHHKKYIYVKICPKKHYASNDLILNLLKDLRKV